MSAKKPDPITPATLTRRCPVCGKPSYSASGEHPQCALARADALLRAANKKKALAAASTPRPPAVSRWSKRCPLCGRQNPARQIVCQCTAAAPSASNGRRKR